MKDNSRLENLDEKVREFCKKHGVVMLGAYIDQKTMGARTFASDSCDTNSLLFLEKLIVNQCNDTFKAISKGP
jgi:hypothetical protein